MLQHKFDQQQATINRKIRKALKDAVILSRGTARELIQNTSTTAGDFSTEEAQAYTDLGTTLDSLGG